MKNKERITSLEERVTALEFAESLKHLRCWSVEWQDQGFGKPNSTALVFAKSELAAINMVRHWNGDMKDAPDYYFTVRETNP